MQVAVAVVKMTEQVVQAVVVKVAVQQPLVLVLQTQVVVVVVETTPQTYQVQQAVQV
jgi:hypothetical protein